MKRMGCLHAHYSNISYIEEAFHDKGIQWMHFVDPGLVYSSDPERDPGDEGAKRRVREQLDWMQRCQLDAILITCTYYAALLSQLSDPISSDIPILTIDEPYFVELCRMNTPQLLLFTNPETVEGTMNRLQQYAVRSGQTVQVGTEVIDGAFPILMQGDKETYDAVISERIRLLLEQKPDCRISVAQLSMVDAVKGQVDHRGNLIGHPLKPLVREVLSVLQLES
ncbi:hypothetical protein [Paenibacillus massiliensis]|uniref:hypothetical protein n=1 Tax=Paenibacillus massiliensis TaxID=225917 RepID=UPI000470D3F7|nr:hypothetical protein [Paenibacillus massiliensis]